jgi:hypothetical protein
VTGSRVNADRGLYLRALADAIDWQESYLDSHEPQIGVTLGHCQPGARCADYQEAAALLARYRAARARALAPPRRRPRGAGQGHARF